MAKYNVKQTPIISPFATERELSDFIHAYGKRANERIADLERRGLENSSLAYRYLTEKSNATLVMSRSGHTKFDLRTRNLNIKELRSRAEKIEQYLNAKTSTAGGIKAASNKTYNTLAKKFGWDKKSFTAADFAKAVTSEAFKNLNKNYYSVKDLQALEYYKDTALLDRVAEETTKHGSKLSILKTEKIINESLGKNRKSGLASKIRRYMKRNDDNE